MNETKPGEIAVVVPTIRPKEMEAFTATWRDLLAAHDAWLVAVEDGENPSVRAIQYFQDGKGRLGYTPTLHCEAEMDLIYNFNDGVRNLGFFYIANGLPNVKYIITLDDDTRPHGDTIADHVHALKQKVPISWFSHSSRYMRGFPYAVRHEADVWVSHGIWNGVADWDAPTQLVDCQDGQPHVEFISGPVPKGALIPVCGMNLGFRREALPYVYFAPMGPKVGLHRFADIWMGINLKRKLDELGKAMVTGMAVVNHERASNVWKNLQQEALGLELNETYWQGKQDHPYFQTYDAARKAWEEKLGVLV